MKLFGDPFISLDGRSPPQEDAVRLKPPDMKTREAVRIQMPLRDDREGRFDPIFSAIKSF
jgi:hypothetical protein